MQKIIPGTALLNLKCNKHKSKQVIDKNAEYAKGFGAKCVERNVNPLHIVEIANLLELKL